MTTYFISRHSGAQDWARKKRLHVDQWVSHLDPQCIHNGDTVIGTMPVNIAAEVCAKGATYIHLSLKVPAHLRGKELTMEDMQQLDACLQAYTIKPLSISDTYTPSKPGITHD